MLNSIDNLTFMPLWEHAEWRCDDLVVYRRCPSPGVDLFVSEEHPPGAIEAIGHWLHNLIK